MDDDKVTCPLCFKAFGSLVMHIICTHKLSLDEFKEQFPDTLLISKMTNKRRSDTCKASGCGKWRKGAKLSDEQRKHLSNVLTGEGNPFYGKHHTDKTKKQMSENHADISGDLNPYKRAMRNDDFRKRIADTHKQTFAEIKADPQRWQKYCDSRSKSTTLAHIRGNMKSYGRGHKHGIYVSTKSPTPIFFRSSYEKRFLELCDNEPLVVTVISSPFWIDYVDENGKSHRYIPDFVINDNIIVETKAPFAIETNIVKLKHFAAEQYCEHRHMKFICITNVDEQFFIVRDFIKSASK